MEYYTPLFCAFVFCETLLVKKDILDILDILTMIPGVPLHPSYQCWLNFVTCLNPPYMQQLWEWGWGGRQPIKIFVHFLTREIFEEKRHFWENFWTAILQVV